MNGWHKCTADIVSAQAALNSQPHRNGTHDAYKCLSNMAFFFPLSFSPSEQFGRQRQHHLKCMATSANVNISVQDPSTGNAIMITQPISNLKNVHKTSRTQRAARKTKSYKQRRKTNRAAVRVPHIMFV